MTIFISHMTVKVQPGKRSEAINAFTSRGVFEECAAAVPGFIRGRILVSTTCLDSLCIVAEWQHEHSYYEWTKHPVRDDQVADLARFLNEAPGNHLFQLM